MVANYVSPIWCPHVILILENYLNVDFDVYSIIQKDKKCDILVLRIVVELKT